jgi:hypothetical protein
LQPDDKTSRQAPAPHQRIERKLRLVTTITQEIAAAGSVKGLLSASSYL